MRTDHNSLAALIATANAGRFRRTGYGSAVRAWWPMICSVAACGVSAYMVLATLAVAADYFDLIGP